MRKQPVVVVAESGSLGFYRAFPMDGEQMEVCAAERGLPATVREGGADLVLIDCGADPEQGLRLLGELKRLGPGIPVIFLADPVCGECALRASVLGARVFFHAPVDLSELQGAMTTLLWLKRSALERRVPFAVASRQSHVCHLPQPAVSPPANILRAVRFIESQFRHPLSLARIAEEACLSRFHFSRAFRKHVGLSPFQFLAYVRIRKALEVLASGNQSILTTGLQVGYHDPREFIRQFRKFTGTTPSAYQKSFRSGNDRRDRALDSNVPKTMLPP